MSRSRNTPRKKQAFTKPPLRFTDQVRKLEDHGLSVPDRHKAGFYLAQLNYYRLAAYCLPYEQDHATHRFMPGTSFDDVLNLYVFDRELRLLVLDAIERFEVSLRTQMAYHLSHVHGSAHPHLQPDLFYDPLVYGGCITKLAAEVRRSREDFIRHLTGKYEEALPPLWACVELMTLGQLSKWFSNVKQRADRQAISRAYGIDEKVMTSFCEHLTLIRNHCAHHARLWNRDFTITMMLPKKGAKPLLDSLFILPDSDRRLRKLYNALVMLAYLMDAISGEHHWKQRLINLIETHNVDPSRMGFPNDWLKRSIWRLANGEETIYGLHRNSEK